MSGVCAEQLCLLVCILACSTCMLDFHLIVGFIVCLCAVHMYVLLCCKVRKVDMLSVFILFVLKYIFSLLTLREKKLLDLVKMTENYQGIAIKNLGLTLCLLWALVCKRDFFVYVCPSICAVCCGR